MPARVRAGCVQLAQDTGLELMGADLYLDESGEWCFAGANSSPDLISGGTPLLDQIAAMLQRGDRR
jgi:hypothetical protein